MRVAVCEKKFRADFFCWPKIKKRNKFVECGKKSFSMQKKSQLVNTASKPY
jgi:hypothetical protein